MSTILYELAISHYCEKIRWALDYKKIPYKKISLVPGLHVLTTKKIAPKTSLPILVDNTNIVQNSSAIITYLDTQYPENPLTPQEDPHKQESLEWEKYADNEIGVNLRCYFYGFLLPHKKIVAPMLTTNASPAKKLLFNIMFPKVRKIMRARMKITPETALQSKEKLQAAIDKIHEHLSKNDFAVGTSFTRADLTFAALLAPIYQPEKYGLKWPNNEPEELREFRKNNLDKVSRIAKIYEEYR